MWTWRNMRSFCRMTMSFCLVIFLSYSICSSVFYKTNLKKASPQFIPKHERFTHRNKHPMFTWNCDDDQCARVRNKQPLWKWVCEDDHCVRKPWNNVSPEPTSLSTCLMTCGPMPIWPKPTGNTTIKSTYSRFPSDNIQIMIENIPTNEVRQLINKAVKVFLENLKLLLPKKNPYAEPTTQCSVNEVDHIKITLNVVGEISEMNSYLTVKTSERYQLEISVTNRIVNAQVTAQGFFGVRHGLETLSQLMWTDEYHVDGFLNVLNDVQVTDEPEFPHRGLMVDSGRNFLPIHSLRTTIDGMAASKLNTLHWHLTDSHSFPFNSPKLPEMALYGAYSRKKMYSAQNVMDVVEYAQVRGVRVLMEIDTPAHTASGWEWGPDAGLGNLSVCLHTRCTEPPCGQLNPNNKHVYQVLGDLYADLVKLTKPTDLFHVGGNQVDLTCWLKSPDVVSPNQFMTKNNLIVLWSKFQSLALRELSKSYRGPVVVWYSDLTASHVVKTHFPKDRYVVQVWDSSRWGEMKALIRKGYRVVLSHMDAWYLHCGYGSWRRNKYSACPYVSWQRVYQHRPWSGKTVTPAARKLVLGGELCLQGDQVDGNALDSLLWPRASALAERLWTDPKDDDNIQEAHERLSLHREHLVARGVRAAALWPEWCHHNPRVCNQPRDEW